MTSQEPEKDTLPSKNREKTARDIGSVDPSLPKLSPMLQGLKERQQNERTAIQDLTENELKSLAKNLSDFASSELKQTVNDMQSQQDELVTALTEELKLTRQSALRASKRARKSLEKERANLRKTWRLGWLKIASLTLVICAGLVMALWGLIEFLAWRVIVQEKKLDEVKAAIAAEKVHLLGADILTMNDGRIVIRIKPDSQIVVERGGKELPGKYAEIWRE